MRRVDTPPIGTGRAATAGSATRSDIPHDISYDSPPQAVSPTGGPALPHDRERRAS